MTQSTHTHAFGRRIRPFSQDILEFDILEFDFCFDILAFRHLFVQGTYFFSRVMRISAGTGCTGTMGTSLVFVLVFGVR